MGSFFRCIEDKVYHKHCVEFYDKANNLFLLIPYQKFVRIKPYSVLSSLYPLSRHGPDRCLICGHSFENHLATWWFPFLYTPFDRHLGEFFEKYTSNPDECQVDAKMQETPFSQYSEPGLEPIYNQNQVNKPFRKREFHKAYVKDITNEQTDNSSRRKDPKTRQRNRARDRYEKQNKNGMNQFFQNRFETRQIVGIKYKVPTIDVSGEEYNLGSALVLALVRTMVLERFESFLVLQERDNRWHDWKMLHEM